MNDKTTNSELIKDHNMHCPDCGAEFCYRKADLLSDRLEAKIAELQKWKDYSKEQLDDALESNKRHYAAWDSFFSIVRKIIDSRVEAPLLETHTEKYLSKLLCDIEEVASKGCSGTFKARSQEEKKEIEKMKAEFKKQKEKQ